VCRADQSKGKHSNVNAPNVCNTFFPFWNVPAFAQEAALTVWLGYAGSLFRLPIGRDRILCRLSDAQGGRAIRSSISVCQALIIFMEGEDARGVYILRQGARNFWPTAKARRSY
jgi:hypothetical protein